MYNPLKQIDTKEIELPKTLFVRDIENKVFQMIVLQCLMSIEDVSLSSGNLIDHLLGRDPSERTAGITIEQDQKTHSVNVRVEVNILYGVSIPDKAEEIQSRIFQELSRLTGLHVSMVHVVFKGLIVREEEGAKSLQQEVEEYTDRF